jgi:hypothetical protein
MVFFIAKNRTKTNQIKADNNDNIIEKNVGKANIPCCIVNGSGMCE